MIRLIKRLKLAWVLLRVGRIDLPSVRAVERAAIRAGLTPVYDNQTHPGWIFVSQLPVDHLCSELLMLG